MKFGSITVLIACLMLLYIADLQFVDSQPIIDPEPTFDFMTRREANLRCNAASKSKRITIQNPTTFNNDLCTYHIQAYSPNVCQLLIEFSKLELLPPNFNPQLNTLECADRLTIGDFALCGDNSGQHLYIPFNVAKGVKEVPIIFTLPTRWPLSSWNLHVTQLECPEIKKRSQAYETSLLSGGISFLNMRTIFGPSPPSTNDWELLAPTGCNQYFTQPTGNIKSFNFQTAGNGHYFQNMHYVICIKSAVGSTLIEYEVEKFSMSIEIETSAGYDSDCHALVQTLGRREDYLMIPNSYVANTLSVTPTYYCGTSLQQRPSVIASAPFTLYFSSDGFSDEKETGFSINYRIRGTL